MSKSLAEGGGREPQRERERERESSIIIVNTKGYSYLLQPLYNSTIVIAAIHIT